MVQFQPAIMMTKRHLHNLAQDLFLTTLSNATSAQVSWVHGHSTPLHSCGLPTNQAPDSASLPCCHAGTLISMAPWMLENRIRKPNSVLLAGGYCTLQYGLALPTLAASKVQRLKQSLSTVKLIQLINSIWVKTMFFEF